MIKELGFKKMNLLLSKPDDLNEIIERAYKMIKDIKDKWIVLNLFNGNHYF